MFLTSTFLFLIFAMLQLLHSKEHVSLFGYVGCGLEIIFSIVFVVVQSVFAENYFHVEQIIMSSIVILLLFNIPTIILLMISVWTNEINKDRRNKLEKIKGNSL